MEIIGKLYKKLGIRNATPTFSICEFVIEVENPRDPRFNDFLLFQLTGERASLIDRYNEGDQVQVTYDIRGRKALSKDGSNRELFFTTLNAWRVDPPQTGFAPQGGYQQQGSYQQPVAPAAPNANVAPTTPPPAVDNGPVEDLPF